MAGFKKTTTSTTAKSRADWDTFKTEAGIDDDLKQKAKDGYLEKWAGLSHSDLVCS